MLAIKGLMQVRLFGGFRCMDANGTAIVIPGRRPRALFAYLLLCPDQSASRERLAGLLWSDRGEEQARSSLRQCLLELKSALGATHSECLQASRTTVALTPGAVQSDVADIDSVLNGNDADAAIAAIEALARSVLLDDLELPGLYRDWLDQERARIDRTVATGLLTQIERLEAVSDWARIITLADAWLSREPSDEVVVAAAIRAELASGAIANAHRRFQALKAVLAKEMGVAPGAAVCAAISESSSVNVSPSDDGQPVIAVLAFDNLSSDPEMEFFSEGVSEEILLNVARTSALRVIARASSFQFRGRDKVSTKIAARLGATHLLDGSVRRSGDQVRITASLVECATQSTLWSGRFDRGLANIFAVQDEIAEAVALELNLIFAPADGREKIDPEAHDLYLRARHLASSPAHVAQCVAYLEEAVSREPDFTAAWASLAMARAVNVRWMVARERFEAEREQALLAAARATALDPGAGLPLVAISLLEPEGRFLEREALLERALRLSPDDPEILKQASDFAGSVGRVTEGMAIMRRAREVDPLNPQIVGHCIVQDFDPDNREPFYHSAAAMHKQWPDYDWASALPILYASTFGDWHIVDQLAAVPGRSREWHMALASANDLRKPIKIVQAETLAAAERQIAKRGSIEIRTLVRLYDIGLGDEAFDALARSDYDYRRTHRPDSVFLLSMIFGVFNIKMRKDVRFMDVCARLGLCDYWVTTGRWPDCVADVAEHYDLKAEAQARAMV